MGINRLEVRGFRSLSHVDWTPGRLNVLIGPNGSGKSNLLQALELLHQAAIGRLADSVFREGGLASLLFDGQATELAFAIDALSACVPPDPVREKSRYELALRRLGDGGSYRVEREELQDCSEIGEPRPSPRTYLSRGGTRAEMLGRADRSACIDPADISQEESLLSSAAGPAGRSSTSVNPGLASFQTRLASWRVYDQLLVTRRSPLRQASVSRRERRLSADGQNLVTVLHTLHEGDLEFEELVKASMTGAFGEEFGTLIFPPAADQTIQLRLRWKSLQREASAAELSDGTLRFLQLLAILGCPEPGDLIAIDEPETGLHPVMMGIVAELAARASEKSQVILTTHSIPMLDALSTHSPVTTVALSSDGQTRLHTLQPGQLSRWLESYTLGELFRSGELEAMG